MSEPKLISPLLDQFVMGDPISEHHGVRCCPAMTKDADKRYIVKIISIPASQVQLEALLLAGAYSSKESARSYFWELAGDIANEAEILKKLSRFEGFVPYEAMQTVPMEDGVGYDVYLLSPYKRSLERHMKKTSMTHLSAVNLGLDLCASMVMCRRAGFLYVDLKPGNIFINEKNEFCVGDLGFVRLDSLKYASLPDKYRSAYTAPELSDAMASMNETVDTYAIGMILYQVFNDGKLPQEGAELTSPIYADYEMAEIILKAISPDPADRWQDPMQMGQALVAYMQRNSVNDVPIVPLPEPVPEEPAVTEAPEDLEESPAPNAEEPESPVPEKHDTPDTDAEEVSEESNGESAPEEPAQDIQPEEKEPSGEDETVDVSDLSFMEEMVSDDTAPDPEAADEISYEELSDDTSDILAQADELLAMETLEPVVAPEPIDIPMPEPIVLEDVPKEEPAAIPADEDPVPEETDSEENCSLPEPADEAKPEEYTEPEPIEVEDEEEFIPAAPPKKGFGCVIAVILAVLILAGCAFGGYYYYQNHYLQNIDRLDVYGHENSMSVLVDTDIDETLLTVICSDTYGNTRTSAVTNGTAVFENLEADTRYKISLIIEGFHELTGETTATYTTPAQTRIVSFEATAGSEDNSVILTFTVDGKDSNSWTVTYSADGENERSETFSGHLITISGLAANKEYTFRLTSADLEYLVGEDTVTFTSEPLVYAENLAITKCDADGLTAVWTVAEGTEVESWTVRCYSDNGYDQTMVTTDLTVTFTDLDPSGAYTVEVTAEGMSTSVRTYISARSAAITSTSIDTSSPLRLTASWEYEGTAPEGGWLVIYSMEDNMPEVIQTTECSVTIYPAMPGDVYHFTIQAADGTTVFNNTFSGTAGKVQVFSGYGVTANNLSFRMCRTPSKENWSYTDLSSSAYTSTFASGEKASFVVFLNSTYATSDDIIETLFVVRNSSGEVVCTSSTASSWTYMWNNGYCELDIPTMPTESGSYTIAIYFNGMAAAQDTFTIQ